MVQKSAMLDRFVGSKMKNRLNQKVTLQSLSGVKLIDSGGQVARPEEDRFRDFIFIELNQGVPSRWLETRVKNDRERREEIRSRFDKMEQTKAHFQNLRNPATEPIVENEEEQFMSDEEEETKQPLADDRAKRIGNQPNAINLQVSGDEDEFDENERLVLCKLHLENFK